MREKIRDALIDAATDKNTELAVLSEDYVKFRVCRKQQTRALDHGRLQTRPRAKLQKQHRLAILRSGVPLQKRSVDFDALKCRLMTDSAMPYLNLCKFGESASRRANFCSERPKFASTLGGA